MCADLMFAFFICPAICDPEPYGITSDAPISYIANNNLMQVAQIIQVLALPDQDGIDQKTKDLYESFPKVCSSPCNLFIWYYDFVKSTTITRPMCIFMIFLSLFQVFIF